MPFVPDKQQTTGFIPDEPPATAGFIPDEPFASERGFFSETGSALTRTFLRGAKGVTGTLTGTMREEPRYSPMMSELFGVTEEEHKEIRKSLQTATEKISAVEEKYPRTWKGPVGWALNTVVEAVGYMGQALAGGYIAGPVGAAMVAFGIEGQEAYEAAIKSGATEEQANTERTIVGSLNAAIEALQIGQLMKFHKTGKHSIVAFKNLIKKRAYKELGKAGGKFTKDVLKNAVQEGLEEFAQEGVSISVPAAMRGDYPKTTEGKPDVWAIGERLGAATLGGFVAGGVLGTGGAVTLATPKLAAPSVQKIEKSAKEIQADERLGEFEKARAIRDLRKMLPEDYEYQPEVTEGAEETTPINVYQDAEGNNYNEQDVTMQKLEGGESQIVAKENGEPVVLNPELSGSAIETEAEPTIIPEVKPEAKQLVSTKSFEIGQKVRPSDRNNIGTIIDISDDTAKVRFINRKTGAKAVKNFALSSLKPLGQKTVKPKKVLPTSKVLERVKSPVSPFYISDQAQQILDIADKFEKHLSEYEARRPELVKGTKARMGGKFKKFRAVLDSLRGQDPREAVNKARSATEGLAREVFPEFKELFTVNDIKAMQRAVNESTLIEGQIETVTKFFDDLEKGVLPARSVVRAFDKFFGTNIAAIGKNKSKTWKQKAWRFARMPGQTIKALLASFDFSAGGIQGLPMLLVNPKIGLANIARGYRAALSPKYVKLREIKIKTHPYYNIARQYGMAMTEVGSLTKGEEEFTNNLAEKIPGIGKGIVGSEQAHCSTLNGMRADYVYKWLDYWGGPENVPPAQIHELCKHANNLTGRGTGKPEGIFEKHMDVWSFFFWVPRMFKATVAAPTDFITKPHIRKMAATELLQGVGLLALYTAFRSLRPDDEKIGTNPLSSDFGKAVSEDGQTRQNIWGRWGRLVRVTCQLALGKKKSPRTGETYYAKRWEIFTDYLRSLLNPIGGVGVDIATGRTFLGEKVQYDDPEFVTKYIAEHVTPLFIQDLIDAVRFQENGPNALNLILAMHGSDMLTYKPDAQNQAYKLKNDYAHQYYGKDWSQLGPGGQQLIRAKHPMIRRHEEDAKRERDNFEYSSQRAHDVGEKVIKSLSKEIRQLYKDAGAIMNPEVAQGVGYNGSWWKMTMPRYEKFQKDLKPALEKSLGMLKSQPGWNELDSTIRRTMIEEMTKKTIKFVRQQMINNISMADLEAYNEPTTETIE